MPAEANTRRVRIAFSLLVAWSILQCALVFAIYGFHLNASAAYILELVPCLPILILAALAARLRALKPDALPRAYLILVIGFAGLCMASGLLTVTVEVSFFQRSIDATGLTAALPFLVGVVPALALLMPRQIMVDSNLGEMLKPVNIKRNTPAVRLQYRLTALAVAYIVCNFASRIFLDSNTPPTGVLAYAIAITPVLPIFGLIWIYNRYMAEEQDEYERHLLNQSILWAFLGTLIVVCAMERFEDYSLVIHRHVNVFHHFSAVWAFLFLQFEARLVIKMIQGARLKRNQ
jgi:hypothetical protein